MQQGSNRKTLFSLVRVGPDVEMGRGAGIPTYGFRQLVDSSPESIPIEAASRGRSVAIA